MLSSVTIPRKGDAFRHSSSFVNRMRYSDESNSFPTTITTCGDDFGFKGPVASIRNKYRNFANYQSGYCIIETPRAKTLYDATKFPDKEMAYIALIDVSTFLSYFSRPLELAATIEKRARETCQQWRRANGSKESLGRRRPVDFESEICRYSWTNDKGKQETSIYEYRLSTYGHTEVVKDMLAPKIDLGDVKFLLKLRTTVGAKVIPDKSAGSEEMRSDNFGYNVRLPHVLGLLRSPGFAKLVKDTQADVDSFKALRDSIPEVSAIPLEEGDEEEREEERKAWEPMQEGDVADGGEQQ